MLYNILYNSTETEQHLTITSDGKVELTRQSFSDEIIEETEFLIDKDEAVVRIVDKNYYTAENVPFPVDKAKHIIRLVEDSEIDEE